MKKTIFLAVTIILALLIGIAFAQNFTLFKPLSIPGYSIRMPDGVVLPDRSVLRLVETRVNPLDQNITMYLYKNPEKIYIAGNGELLYPYMEVTIKAEDGVHLVTLSFINEKIEIEMYENRAAFGDYGNDELMRIEYFKQRKIKEFNR